MTKSNYLFSLLEVLKNGFYKVHFGVSKIFFYSSHKGGGETEAGVTNVTLFFFEDFPTLFNWCFFHFDFNRFSHFPLIFL